MDKEAQEKIAEWLYYKLSKTHIPDDRIVTWEKLNESAKGFYREDADQILKLIGYHKLPDEPLDDDKWAIIDDGFGCSCSAYCPECGEKSMFVCRPSDIRCANCEGE